MSQIKQTAKHFLKIPISVFLGVLFLDQLLKYAAEKKIWDVDIHKNYNALFGIPFYHYYSVLLFASIAFFFIINIKKAVITKSSTVLISLSLLSAGIASNLADRLTKGYILDYVTIFDTFSFNIADLGIYSGVYILLWKIIKK